MPPPDFRSLLPPVGAPPTSTVASARKGPTPLALSLSLTARDCSVCSRWHWQPVRVSLRTRHCSGALAPDLVEAWDWLLFIARWRSDRWESTLLSLPWSPVHCPSCSGFGK